VGNEVIFHLSVVVCLSNSKSIPDHLVRAQTKCENQLHLHIQQHRGSILTHTQTVLKETIVKLRRKVPVTDAISHTEVKNYKAKR